MPVSVRLLVPLALAPLVAGCVEVQSMFSPAGPHAEQVAYLGWLMIIGGFAIFALVLILAALAIVLPARSRRWMGGRGFIVSLGVVFPVVVLAALLVWGLGMVRALDTGESPALRVEVVGVQWWWEVRYLGPDGDVRLTTANEIVVPTGRTVEYVLRTEDVIHSFWVPVLAGKLDMIPGRINTIRFAANRPGVYRGQCAEYCGGQHALMALDVVALEAADFEAWWRLNAGPALPPRTPQQIAGAEVFRQWGCGGCHAVRGTEANGEIGPDLTHVGSRLRIAAGTFPNTIGTLAGWVASAQHLKPGNGMPSFDRMTGPELRAVAAYLEGLK